MAKKSAKKKTSKRSTSRSGARSAARKKAPARRATAASEKTSSRRKKTAARSSSTRKKPAAKKKASRAAASRTKKVAAKKKTTTKKTVAKKTAAKKTAAKKTAAKKTTTTAAKKTTKKKTTAKSAATKATTTKATTKKAAATKATATKAAATKAAATKAATKKAATKKASGPASRNGEKKPRRKPRLGARSVAEAASAGKADAQGYVYVNGRRVRMISTGGAGITKPTRSARRAAEEEVETDDTIKNIKTKLTAKELRGYRKLLLEKRAELVGDVSAMEEEALQARGGNLSNLPIHMADIGTDTYDQDFMLGLAEHERRRLREIDDALRRIQDKTYGVCQMTGKPIPKARLNAKPWAKYTIEAARLLERQWQQG